MKISSGGLGTVATAQGFNAKSAYPYQWSWNAVGTDLSSTTSSDVIYTLANARVEPHPLGIKQMPGLVENDGALHVKYHDEKGTPPGGNRSGPLNRTDISKAKYIHLVIDLKSGNENNWADTILSDFTGPHERGEQGGWSHGVLTYDDEGGSSSVAGGVAIFPHSLNSNTFILVFSPADQIHRQGSNQWAGGPAPFTDPDKPHVLSFYPTNAFDANLDNYLIIMGYVIADRILTDIPLPIRTHMG